MEVAIMDLEIVREFLGAVVDIESGAQPVNSVKPKPKYLCATARRRSLVAFTPVTRKKDQRNTRTHEHSRDWLVV